MKSKNRNPSRASAAPEPSDPPGRPEPRRGRPRDRELEARRRAEIVEQAIRHFARSGYAGADLDALAADAGCAKGTLYRYFPSKEHLFHAAVDFVMGGLLDATAGASTGDVLDQIRAGVRAFLAYFDAHPEYVELLMLERAEFRDRPRPTYPEHREANRRRWRKRLKGLIDEGRIRRVAPDVVLDVLGNALYGAIFTHYFSGRTGPLAKQADGILDLVFHGLLPRAAAEEEGR